MRVALVASLISPLRPAEANGPHAIITDLAQGLQALDHEVTVYGAPGSALAGVRVVEVPVEAQAAAATFRAGASASDAAVDALNRGFRRLYARIREERPDVVSQHAFDAAAIELADRLPVLHTLHLPPLSGPVVAAARATSAPLATVSEAAAALWRRAGVQRVAVLRNGVPSRAAPAASVLPVALVAGRISPEKGTDAAIRVARRGGLGVLVAGDVYDSGYHRGQVEPLLRPGEWLGAVPRRVLSELMARCAVLVMPVRWEEPFGLVAAEAQMAGCPVVAYRRGALPEVVADGVGGWLVAPDDEDALLAAVRRAGSLDRAAIRARAERELGVGPMVASYEAALTALAAPGRRRVQPGRTRDGAAQFVRGHDRRARTHPGSDRVSATTARAG